MHQLRVYNSSNFGGYQITTQTTDNDRITSTLKTKLWDTNAEIATFACRSENIHGSVTSSPIMPESNLGAYISVTKWFIKQGVRPEFQGRKGDKESKDKFFIIQLPISRTLQ